MRTALLLAPLLLAALLLVPPSLASSSAVPPPASTPAGASPPSAGAASVYEWPTYRGGPSRTGFTPADGPDSGLITWIASVSNTSSRHLRTSVAVNGSFAYAADDLGSVYAFNDTNNGSLLWRSSVGVVPTAPTLAGSSLYLGDSDSDVTALSTADGAVEWKRSVGGTVVGALVVENSTVFAGTMTGGVSALRASDGSVEWSRSVGTAVAGAPAFDGRQLYVTTANGTLFALDPATGATNWSDPTGGLLLSGATTENGSVLVLTTNGNLTDYRASDGAIGWRFVERGEPFSGPGDAPAAVDATTAYFTNNLGGIYAVWLSNGSLRWQSSTPPPYSTGYPEVSAPVITPSALYLVDALANLDDLSPTDGTVRWSDPIGSAVYASPAVVGGAIALGTDDSDLLWIGSLFGGSHWPVSGVVRATNGTPIAGATVALEFGSSAVTDANGRFTLELANGSYTLEVSAPTYVSASFPVAVAGATSNLSFVLRLVSLYPIVGEVVDASSFRPLAGVTVRLIAAQYGIFRTVRSAPNGTFVILGANGTNYVTADPPNGYQGVYEHVGVAGAPVSGIRLTLPPVALSAAPSDLLSNAWLATLPLLALAAGAVALGYWAAAMARRRAGLSTRVFSPFGRYVLMRAVVTIPQALALLTVLYVFGNFLPAVSRHIFNCGVPSSLVASCNADYFLTGWWDFITRMFTLNWGSASFGHLSEPVMQYFAWWLPPSLELSAFALAISVLVSYPVGLRAGWRPDGGFDTGARTVSLLALLIPTFLILIIILGLSYNSFLNAFGDSPYGTLPGLQWWDAHGGGTPSWIGLGGNTEPTGFPLIDGLLHQAWTFEGVVLLKTLLQSSLIALVYVSIFFRYARHAVVERAQSLPIVAARARGVPESTLLWRHTGREVIPVYVLIFGITLPIFIGTQAVAEALFNDTGIGRVLIAEITFVQQTGFGFVATGGAPAGNLYQVTIFLLMILVLIASLASDILTHYLDPRLYREGP